MSFVTMRLSSLNWFKPLEYIARILDAEDGRVATISNLQGVS